MNKERFVVANAVALVTHAITQPLDLIKVRQQMLQEGKTFAGIGFQKGDNGARILEEIGAQGGSIKKYYTSYEGFAMKTLAYTTVRVSAFLYFFDWINHDPRRYTRPDWQFYAALGGGMTAGILPNPLEIVFTRM